MGLYYSALFLFSIQICNVSVEQVIQARRLTRLFEVTLGNFCVDHRDDLGRPSGMLCGISQ